MEVSAENNFHLVQNLGNLRFYPAVYIEDARRLSRHIWTVILTFTAHE